LLAAVSVLLFAAVVASSGIFAPPAKAQTGSSSDAVQEIEFDVSNNEIHDIELTWSDDETASILLRQYDNKPSYLPAPLKLGKA